jgi:hypothetical protein
MKRFKITYSRFKMERDSRLQIQDSRLGEAYDAKKVIQDCRFKI